MANLPPARPAVARETNPIARVRSRIRLAPTPRARALPGPPAIRVWLANRDVHIATHYKAVNKQLAIVISHRGVGVANVTGGMFSLESWQVVLSSALPGGDTLPNQ